MKFFRYLMLTVAAVFTLSAASAQDVISWKHKVDHVEGDIYRVTFEAAIQAGWHIYDLGPYNGGPIATTVTFEKSQGLEITGKLTPRPAPKKHFDDVWGMDIGYFEGKAVISQDVKLKGDKATLKGLIEWQSCNDSNCLPPDEFEFSVEIVKAPAKPAAKPVAEAVQETETTTAATTAAAAVSAPEAATAVAAEASAAEETTEEVPAEVEPATENETATVAADNVEEATLSSADEPEKESFWGKIWMAIAWGFVALLTPCVFPMVPVTVSFFMKGGENKATARFRAIAYGLFIITLYTLPILIIVLVTMLFGGNDGVAGVFNWFATHWAPNLVFFIVFMIFAASFFGAFEITLPSSMVNKSDSKADKGGLVGVFFMALTLVLVSFSCTGPIVGTVLVEAAQGSTAWWEPVLIMMAFSTIFAIPFTLLAFAPSLMTKLKSGSWLNAVKVSLGFVEVALGFKFLMVIDQSYGLNIFSRELYIAIWVACGLLWAVYLLGGFKTKHDSDVKYIGPMRLTFAIIVLVFTLWMVPGMWGAPLKPLSGYMPPISAQNYKVASADDLKNISVVGGGESTGHGEFINPLTGKAPLFSDMDGIHAPGGFTAFFDYEEAMEYAKHVGKPLFIDVTGIACVNCREMEQNVWTDPTVARILREDYVMVCIFMDVKQDLPEKYWVVDDKGKTRKQMGKINTAWSLKNFNQVAQPLYVLMDPRDGKQLGPTRAYDKSVPAYIEWLENGKTTYAGK